MQSPQMLCVTECVFQSTVATVKKKKTQPTNPAIVTHV